MTRRLFGTKPLPEPVSAGRPVINLSENWIKMKLLFLYLGNAIYKMVEFWASMGQCKPYIVHVLPRENPLAKRNTTQ